MGRGYGGKDGLGGRRIDTGRENVGARGGHSGEDFGGLLRGFVLRVDDFGEAGAEGSVMIDPGVAEVFVRERGQALGGGGGSECTGLDLRRGVREGWLCS